MAKQIIIPVNLKALPGDRVTVLNNRSKKWEEGTVQSLDVRFPGWSSKDKKYHYPGYRVQLDRQRKNGLLFCYVADEGIYKI